MRSISTNQNSFIYKRMRLKKDIEKIFTDLGSPIIKQAADAIEIQIHLGWCGIVERNNPRPFTTKCELNCCYTDINIVREVCIHGIFRRLSLYCIARSSIFLTKNSSFFFIECGSTNWACTSVCLIVRVKRPWRYMGNYLCNVYLNGIAYYIFLPLFLSSWFRK